MGTGSVGEPLSTTAAATRAGVSRSGFASLVSRAKAAGVELYRPRAEWPDSRTPLVDGTKLTEYLSRRPGRGRRAAS